MFDVTTTGPEADVAAKLASLDLERNAVELTVRGYTVVEDAAPPDLVERLRVRIPSCAAEASEAPFEAMQMVTHVLDRDPVFEEALCNPKVVALAEYVCGLGVILSQMSGSIKGQGTEAMRLHSDYALVREPFPVYPQEVTAVWALDDFTAAGGCTSVVPGSHALRRHPIPGEGLDRAVPVECPKGSVVMWDGATWHGNFPRTIPGERIALHVAMNRMTMRPFERYDLAQEVIDRNPPEFAWLLGLNDPFEKTTWWGNDYEKVAYCNRIFRT